MARRLSMAEIRRRYAAATAGREAHWFDRSTRRFFNDRLPDHGWEGPGGVYFTHSIQFVSSEGYRAPRQHKVVRLNEHGEYPGIDIVGHGAGTDYDTGAEAEAVAKRLADGEAGRERSRAARRAGVR